MKQKDVYLAVDVGGTKILAALVDASGMVLRREKSPTPREGGAGTLHQALENVVAQLLRKASDITLDDLAAMGIGVPGVVDTDQGLVVVTPNMGLSNTRLGEYCEKTFRLTVAVANDCNLGILGEKWLGSARAADSAMGILVGTGIGGGFIQGSEVWQGARGAASEIGHIVMEIGGPLCGCGNRGCLEALASRTAIERDLREAVAAGRPTVLTELLEGDLDLIRSSILRQALERNDTLVTGVLRHASIVLGHACLTVDHLLDPEVIVLGGGVIDACSNFIVPIVQKIVADDCLAAGRDTSGVLVSSLGDDAVLLGATAMARLRIGENPFKKRFAVASSYPPIVRGKSDVYELGSKRFDADFYVTASGKAKRHRAEPYPTSLDGSRLLTPQHLSRPCRGGPHVLFIAMGAKSDLKLSDDACLYLRQRAIEWHALPNDEAVEAYNECADRKAALVHVG
ncbi:MAG: ROK family protein [Pirellulales bacterium]|nr:ROK family protein [Pirellulales bacterium]